MLHVANSRSATILAGVIAGILSTLVQILLWLGFTDGFPAFLFRDARLTAALALGNSVLPPPATFDMGVMLAAAAIHFTLSIVYAALLLRFASRLEIAPAMLVGAGFGIVLYIVNLYGFTMVFPWFAQVRGWITLAAHVAFGISVVLAYRCLYSGCAQD